MQLRKVAGERLLILKDGHCLREESLEVCSRARTQFSEQFEADQFASIFALIREGKADLLMKGKIKTSAIVKAVLDKENGLRTGRLLSQVIVFEVPGCNR